MLTTAESTASTTTFKVVFKSVNEVYKEVTVTKYTTVTKPADPTREGYRFAGWYESGVLYDFTSAVKREMELEAKWISNQTNGEQRAEQIKINQGTSTLYEGQTLQLSLSVIPNYAIWEAVEWSSSDPSYASVSNNGLVKILQYKAEPITITATRGSLSDTCQFQILATEVPEDDRKDSDGNLRKVINGIWIIGMVDNQTYTGQKLNQTLRVYDQNKLLKEGTDYSLTYKNNINAHANNENSKTPSVTVNMKGSYRGKKTFYYTIDQVELDSEKVLSEADTPTLNYDKNKKKQIYKPVLTYNGKKLVEKKDYIILNGFTGEKGEPGQEKTVTYTIEGKGNYKGTREITYRIVDKAVNLANAKVSIKNKNVKFTGKKIELSDLGATIVLPGSKEKLPIEDCTEINAEISDAEHVGKNVVLTITPKKNGDGTSNFIGERKVKFNIVAGIQLKKDVIVKDASACSFREELTYDSQKIKENGGMLQNTTGMLSYDGKDLVEGEDYSVSYSNHKRVGTAKVTIKGKGKYTGTITRSYRILPNTSINVTNPGTQRYTKGGTTPKLVVKDGAGTVLSSQTDYTVRYSNHKAIGTATYEIIGKGNYKGAEATGTYTIVASNLKLCAITAPDKAESGKENAYRSTPTVVDTNGKKLKAGVDYEKEIQYDYESKETNSKPEKGTVITLTIKGMGNYEGTATQSYRIYDSKKTLSKLYIAIDAQEYTGNAIMPILNQDIHVALSKKDLKNKNYVQDAADYVSIVSYQNHTKVGTGKVTLRASDQGEYSGTRTVSFQITKRALIDPKITLTSSFISAKPGKEVTVTAKIEPARYEEEALEWSIGNPSLISMTVAADQRSATIKFLDYGKSEIHITCQELGITTVCRTGCYRDISVTDHGAVPNDGKSDEKAINAALAEANANGGGTVVIPPGVYDINLVNDGKHSDWLILFWECKNITLKLEDGAVLKGIGNNAANYTMVGFYKSENCTITGGKIMGERDSHTGGDGEWGHCIATWESKNITISNMEICKGWGDGVYIGDNGDPSKDNRYITIKNCKIHDNRRNNISITAGDDITIEDCTIENAHGTAPQDGIDIETNLDSNPCNRITITRTVIQGNADVALRIERPANDITLTDCTLKGGSNGAIINAAGHNVKLVNTSVAGAIYDNVGGITKQ